MKSQVRRAEESFSLLMNRSVKLELELNDEQLKFINEAKSRRYAKINSILTDKNAAAEFDALSVPERKKFVEQGYQQLIDVTNQCMRKLVPSQLIRFRQIQIQRFALKSNYILPSASDLVRNKLNVSKEQNTRILQISNDLASKVSREIEEAENDIAKMVQEAEEQLIGSLNKSKASRLEELFGPKIPASLFPANDDLFRIVPARGKRDEGK